ncbi:MAG: HlyD family efflux transporter periplasmic adaptor subunit [Planctomycetota bacterium]
MSTNFNAEKLAILSIDRKKDRKKSNRLVPFLFLLAVFVFFFAPRPLSSIPFLSPFFSLNSLQNPEVEVESLRLYSSTQLSSSEILTASGYVMAQRKVSINSEWTRKLVQIFVKQGQEVEENQILGLLDSEGLDLDIQRKKQEMTQNSAQEKKWEAQALQVSAELIKAQETIRQIAQELEEAEQQVSFYEEATRESEASLRERESSLRQNIQDLDRLRKLYKEGIISLEEFEQKQTQNNTSKATVEAAQSRVSQSKNSHKSAQSRVKQTQIRLELAKSDIQIIQARLQASQSEQLASQEYTKLLGIELKHLEWDLDRLKLRAPWKGIVFSNVQPVGSMLTPIGGSSGALSGDNFLCEILDPASLMAEVDIAEGYLYKIALNQRVMIQLDAIPNQKFYGNVFLITPTANKQKSTVQVKIKFNTLPPQVYHQMSLRLSFLQDTPVVSASEPPRKMLLIPAKALLPDGNSVWIYQNGVAHKRSIQTGETLGSQLEVLTGLSAGDQIIIQSTAELQENQKVVLKKT